MHSLFLFCKCQTIHHPTDSRSREYGVSYEKLNGILLSVELNLA